MLNIDNISDKNLDKIKNCDDKNNNIRFQFNVDEMKYMLQISLSRCRDRKIAEFEFMLLNSPKFPNKSNFENNEQYQIELKKSMFGITGTGNPFRVLSKVGSLMYHYTKEEDIKYISLTVDEENRQLLYKKLLQRTIRKVNAPYKFLTIHPITGFKLDSSEFWIEKIYNPSDPWE